MDRCGVRPRKTVSIQRQKLERKQAPSSSQGHLAAETQGGHSSREVCQYVGDQCNNL